MFWVTDYNNQQPQNLVNKSLVKPTKNQILVNTWVPNRHMILIAYPTTHVVWIPHAL